MTDIKKDIVSATDVGLVREHNEDSCGVSQTPNGALCVVCDGMGGHSGGETASRLAVDCIIQRLSSEHYADSRQAIGEALDFANTQILGVASENAELKGMGTTACVALVQDECVWIAHIGDSRIYLFEAATGRLHRLTKDHSYVQGLVEQGMITPEEAEHHVDKNRIMRALGVRDEIVPDIPEKPLLLAMGDILLLCSDGLSGMVSDSEIERILRGGEAKGAKKRSVKAAHDGKQKRTSLQEKSEALMSAAKNAGGTDNITFQLVKISNSPHRKSVFESKNYDAAQQTQIKSLLGAIAKPLLRYAAVAVVAIGLVGVGVFIGKGIYGDSGGGKDENVETKDTANTKSSQETYTMKADTPAVVDHPEPKKPENKTDTVPLSEKWGQNRNAVAHPETIKKASVQDSLPKANARKDSTKQTQNETDSPNKKREKSQRMQLPEQETESINNNKEKEEPQ
jgi:protein phosphatase